MSGPGQSKASLHIGFCSAALPSSSAANGIATYTRIMQAALRALGHRVTVVTAHAIERADRSVVEVAPDPLAKLERAVARIPGFGPARARHRPDLARIVRAEHRRNPFDIFEMEESGGWSAHLGLDVPVVVRLHGPHFLGKDDRESTAQAKASIQRIADEGTGIAKAQGVTSPSAGLLAASLKHYGIAPKHAEVIYNPIAVAPPEQCWSIERCSPNQLLFVGRFDLRKGADIALEAFALAAARNPGLRLVMCGPDPGIMLSSGERLHFPEYLATMMAPGLHGRIDYKGALPATEIARLRRESALCLSTSRFEVFAYSMTEALAVGMPLIASDTFGMSEMLCHGENGFIVPVGDAAGVAATIEAALASPQRLAAIGAASRDLCEAVLNPQVIAEKMIEFYRKLL